MTAVITLGLAYLFIAYFALLNLSYLILNITGAISLARKQSLDQFSSLPLDYGRFEPAVSLLVPAYNEAATIISSLQSILQLEYHTYEVIVINDGSRDQTLQVLIDHFELIQIPLVETEAIATQTIRGLYHCQRYPFLKVLDKENGGKADSLNAGINTAQYDLVCCLDADSILQRDSLRGMVQPFIDDPLTICSGGTVRVANGSLISGGFLQKVGLSRHPLALFQSVEYLRAFLFGRESWSVMNALLIVSGAFGLFDKKIMIEIGGYRTQTIGEDMELTVRMHRLMKAQRRAYRICFLAQPICWTEAPEDLSTLRNQRIRWQRGLLESLRLNWRLISNPRGGLVSWLAFPFFLIFEALGPLIEVGAYLILIPGFVVGIFSFKVLLLFISISIGMGMAVSISALLLEEICFHLYPRKRHILILALFALLENLGYRQLNSWWRLIGLYRWLTQQEQAWGVMRRKGTGSA